MKKRSDVDMANVLCVFDVFCEECGKHKDEKTFIIDCPFCGKESALEVFDFLCDANGQCTVCRKSIHVKWDSSRKI